jgi:hypothetical protein
MSKGGGKTVETKSSSAPWAGVQPYYLDIFNRGQGLYNSQPDQSTNTVAAQDMMAQRARAGSPLLPAAQQGLLSTMRGDYLSPDSNPYLKANVDTAMGQAKAGVDQNFQGDSYGNSAHQEWLARTLGQTAGQMYGDNYNRERQNQLAATQAAPGLAAADYMDADKLAQVGAQQTAAPWDKLFNYTKTIGGLPAGSDTTSQQPYFDNPLANLMGMGLGAFGMYGMGKGFGLFGG